MSNKSHYQIKIYRSDSADFIKISGSLIMTNFEEIFAQLEEVAKSENTDIYLDLSELRMVDSTGLGMLVQLNMRLKGMKKKFTLLRPQPAIQRLFSLSKIQMLIPVLEGIDATEICENMEKAENLFESSNTPETDPISA